MRSLYYWKRPPHTPTAIELVEERLVSFSSSPSTCHRKLLTWTQTNTFVYKGTRVKITFASIDHWHFASAFFCIILRQKNNNLLNNVCLCSLSVNWSDVNTKKIQSKTCVNYFCECQLMALVKVTTRSGSALVVTVDSLLHLFHFYSSQVCAKLCMFCLLFSTLCILIRVSLGLCFALHFCPPLFTVLTCARCVHSLKLSLRVELDIHTLHKRRERERETHLTSHRCQFDSLSHTQLLPWKIQSTDRPLIQLATVTCPLLKSLHLLILPQLAFCKGTANISLSPSPLFHRFLCKWHWTCQSNFNKWIEQNERAKNKSFSPFNWTTRKVCSTLLTAIEY